MRARREWLGILGAALATAACEAPKRDPLPILRATAKQYASLRTYYFVEKTVLTPSDGSLPRTLESVIAGTSGGKSRYEMSAPIGKTIMVSDGKTDWLYFPDSNQYQAGVAGSLPLASLGRELVRSYSMLDSTIERATWLRKEVLVVGTEPHVCDVILVVERPTFPAVADAEADRLWRAEWTNVPKTYWIDRRYRVLRTLSVSEKGSRTESSVSVARINDDLSEELFASPVPAGATRLNAPE